MSYVEGEDRGQASLLPARVDDYIGADAMVRVIDAFVVRLDMRELKFRRAAPEWMGRPGYDPRDLLKLYVWGYLNEVRSSRKLERECQRNLETMWLVRRLTPDFKTIADFRRDNGSAIRAACAAFVQFCREQGLVAGRTVAIDGSKFRAAASARRIMGEREIAAEKEKVEAYLAAMNAKDAEETEQSDPAERAKIAAALAALREREEKIAEVEKVHAASERMVVVVGEPDARAVTLGHRMLPVYNVQTAVESESGIIVHHEVVDAATDNQQLLPVALAAQAALGGGDLQVIADAGYSNGAQAAACEAAGIEPCAPANRSANPHGKELFARADFVYRSVDDSYTCPAGERLTRIGFAKRDQLSVYTTKACASCALKARCTKGKQRRVTRHRHEDALQRMNARVKADPGLMRQRAHLAEGPFAILKRMTGGRFLTRGLNKVAAEMALSVLALNLRRMANRIGAEPLRLALE